MIALRVWGFYDEMLSWTGGIPGTRRVSRRTYLFITREPQRMGYTATSHRAWIGGRMVAR